MNIIENEFIEVFKTRKPINRTPPKADADDGNTQKRPRSETSPPSSDDRQKIRKHFVETIRDNDNENIKIQTTENQEQCHQIETNGNFIEKALEALTNIYTFSEKTNFEEKDLSAMRKACFHLHTTVTGLVYKLGQLETENMMLKKGEISNRNQLVSDHEKKDTNERHMDTTETDTQKELINRKNTYATITQNNSPKVLNMQEAKPWTTPKISKKLETIIRIKNV